MFPVIPLFARCNAPVRAGTGDALRLMGPENLDIISFMPRLRGRRAPAQFTVVKWYCVVESYTFPAPNTLSGKFAW